MSLTHFVIKTYFILFEKILSKVGIIQIYTYVYFLIQKILISILIFSKIMHFLTFHMWAGIFWKTTILYETFFFIYLCMGEYCKIHKILSCFNCLNFVEYTINPFSGCIITVNSLHQLRFEKITSPLQAWLVVELSQLSIRGTWA